MKTSWYSIEDLDRRSKFDLLLAGFEANRFVAGSLTGFRVALIRRGLIHASYIERTEFVERVVDPFGVTTDIPRVRFDSIDFRIYSFFPQLELVNPPRNAANLISSISRIFDFSSAIEKPSVDISRWLLELEREFKKLEVTNMVFTQMPLGNVTIGQLSAKGDKDVRKEVKAFLGKRPASLNKVGFSFTFEGQPAKGEITSSCRAIVEGEDSGEIMEILRKSLAKSLNR
jgi:hypothetical protein